MTGTFHNKSYEYLKSFAFCYFCYCRGKKGNSDDWILIAVAFKWMKDKTFIKYDFFCFLLWFYDLIVVNKLKSCT